MKLAFPMRIIKIITLVMVIIAVGCMVATGWLAYQDTHKMQNWDESSGVVTRLSRASEWFIIKYEYGEEVIEYKSETYYSSSIDIGDIIIIYINPNNPKEVFVANELIFPFITGGIGLIFLITGSIFFLVNFIKDRRNRMCLENGRRVRVKIGRMIKTSSNFGNKTVYRLAVNYKDKEYISQAYYYSDEYFDVCEEHVVDLYLYENKHYIDLESVKSGDIFDDFFQSN